MCGLWGGSTNTLVGGEKAVIEGLAMVSAVRGIHSTGIAVVRRGKKASFAYEVHKTLEHPSVLITSNEAKDVINKGNCSLIMGHNRWATVGDVTAENAHPFEFRNIIGCHNGSIQSSHWTKYIKKGGTDSELLFERIAVDGLEATLKEVNELDGHFALTFLDMTRGTLNFIRNDKRPLWLATAKGGLLYWASERWMLKAIGSREWDINMAEPELLPPNTLVNTPIGEHPRLTIRKLDLEPKKTKWFNNRSMFDDSQLGPILPEQHKGRVPPKPEPINPPRMVPMSVQEVLEARQKQEDQRAGDDAKKKADAVVAKLKIDYCITCQKEKQFCNCSSYATPIEKKKPKLVLPGLGGPSVPEVKPKNASSERKGKAIILVQDAVKEGYSCFQGISGDITLQAAEDILKNGCTHCTRHVYLEDDVYWLSDEEFVCGPCVATDDFVQYTIKHEYGGQLVKGGLKK